MDGDPPPGNLNFSEMHESFFFNKSLLKPGVRFISMATVMRTHQSMVLATRWDHH